MPTVTCLDAVASEQERPKVTVRRYPVDWNLEPGATVKRANAILADQPHQSVYLNPAFTVACPEPTPEFFQEVRKRQAEWCRRAGHWLPARVRRRVSNWVTGGEPLRTKAEQHFHRALSYTGVLYVNTEFIHPSKWKSLEHRSVSR